MGTQLRHYVTDDPRRWDELLPVLTMAYNCQPRRSTDIAPFELVLPRRIPSLSVRKLPPGTPLTNIGTLNDGSPLARKLKVTAKVRQQIPAVVEALQKTQQSYKRNFDSVEHGSAIPFVGTYPVEHWDSILGIYLRTCRMFCTCVYLICWSRSGHSLLG